MNPFAVVPTPTLACSTRTLSPMERGKFSLYSSAMVAVTVLSEALYTKLLTLIPFGLSKGRMTGLALFKDWEFLRILTFVSPKLYLISISEIFFPVDPSKTIRAGGTVYPWPNEVIPILLNLRKVVNSKIWGICASGAKVGSVG